MAIVGPWAIAVYKGKVNWGSVPVPTKDGTPAADTWTFSDAKNVGLFTACKNQGTAWEVLKFATSEEQDCALLDKTGQMPLRKDLQTVYADYFTKNQAYKVFGDQAARTIEVPAGPQHRRDAADPPRRLHQGRDQRARVTWPRSCRPPPTRSPNWPAEVAVTHWSVALRAP